MSSSNARARLRRVGHHDIGAAPVARWDDPAAWTGGGDLPLERIEAARQAAYQEGYLAGQADAEAQRQAAAEEERRQVRAALLAAASTIARTRSEVISEATAEAVDLALDLAETLVGRELSLSEHVDADAVARALELAPSGDDLLIRLHPEHRAEVEGIERAVPGVKVTVVADPAIERGGCVVEAGSCRIDAQVATAMARARSLIATAGARGNAA